MNNFLKHAHEKQSQQLFSSLSTQKAKWKFINDFNKDNEVKLEALRNSFGTKITNPKQMADLMNYKFATLGQFYPEHQTDEMIKSHSGISDLFDFRFITSYEVYECINQLESSKPSGPNNIPVWAIKDSAVIINQYLTHIFNEAIKESIFPQILKKSTVTPIYKDGSELEPENYRPISITCPFAKVLEKLIEKQMRIFINDKKLFNGKQFGFRKGYSTVDALLHTVETIRNDINENKYVTAVFLDLSKAFDSLSHKILIKGLENLGFSNSACRLLSSFLQNREQRTKVNNILSDTYTLQQGVPQGTILGPLLFLLYINDLPDILDINSILYADDTTLYKSHTSLTECKASLEQNLQRIVTYFKTKKLKLNVAKTKLVIFSKKSLNSNKTLQITIDGQQINSQDGTKFLRVMLHHNLDFQDHINTMLRKMSAGIRTIEIVRRTIPLKSRIALLKALVLSHLQYSMNLLTSITEIQKKQIIKQIKWGMRVCVFKRKRETAFPHQASHKLLPFELLLEKSCLLYYQKYFLNLLPAFKDQVKLPNINCTVNKRTKIRKLYSNAGSKILKDSFAFFTIRKFNALPLALRQLDQSKTFCSKLNSRAIE